MHQFLSWDIFTSMNAENIQSKRFFPYTRRAHTHTHARNKKCRIKKSRHSLCYNVVHVQCATSIYVQMNKFSYSSNIDRLPVQIDYEKVQCEERISNFMSLYRFELRAISIFFVPVLWWTMKICRISRGKNVVRLLKCHSTGESQWNKLLFCQAVFSQASIHNLTQIVTRLMLMPGYAHWIKMIASLSIAHRSHALKNCYLNEFLSYVLSVLSIVLYFHSSSCIWCLLHRSQ